MCGVCVATATRLPPPHGPTPPLLQPSCVVDTCRQGRASEAGLPYTALLVHSVARGSRHCACPLLPSGGVLLVFFCCCSCVSGVFIKFHFLPMLCVQLLLGHKLCPTCTSLPSMICFFLLFVLVQWFSFSLFLQTRKLFTETRKTIRTFFF